MQGQQPKEVDFIRDRLMPVLRGLGYKNVRFTHGLDEFGRDVVFEDRCRFGLVHYYGAQVKVGNVSGSASSRISNLCEQIEVALRQPYVDTTSGRKARLSGLYVIITGTFTRNAKEILLERLNTGAVWLIDGECLANVRARRDDRLGDLVRRGKAAMRVNPADVQPLRTILEEIDLLEDSGAYDKLEAIRELSEEIVLNSDAGTIAILDSIMVGTQILWWSRGDRDHGGPEGWDQMTAVAFLFCEMLMDALEYGRSDETCKQLGSFLAVLHERALKGGSTEAVRVCVGALQGPFRFDDAKKRPAMAAYLAALARKLESAAGRSE